ncbi:hypothetical protein [Streptomyces virginiae]|nr:hypothetical protein [Streptomyces sp. CMAA1738]MEC4573152.1 hypothetical protein [Streptomyces sp. CMAA1738]
MTAAPQIACRPLHPDEPHSIAGYRLLGRIGAGGIRSTRPSPQPSSGP